MLNNQQHEREDKPVEGMDKTITQSSVRSSTYIMIIQRQIGISNIPVRMRAMFTLTTLKQSSSHSSGAGTAPVVAEEAVVVGKRSHESEIGLPPFPVEIQVLRDECG